ncbi:MAG: sugar phosphate isomerase/epimerase family protein [Planctomycetota bacterium]
MTEEEDLQTSGAEVRLACSTIAWGRNGFVEAVGAISSLGYDGVECPAHLVREYEDRLHVFEEILDASRLKLCAMLQRGDFLERETADATVERVANTARFLGAIGAPALVVSPSNRLEDGADLDDDDWTTAAAILEEMGQRCDEFGVKLAYRPRAGHIAGDDKGIKRILGMVDPALVHLCGDTAELALEDIGIERFFKTYGERVVHVRLRDASGAKRRAAVTSDVSGSAPQFGRGTVDFAKVGRAIARSGYSGWVSVEIAGEGHTPRSAAEGAFRYMMRKSGLFL